MSRKEKLIERLLSRPADFTIDEAIRLLGYWGYTLSSKGKTSGSRIVFVCNGRKDIVMHRPHPGKVLKKYQIDQLLEILKEEGLVI